MGRDEGSAAAQSGHARIMVVDDDAAIAELVAGIFETEGMEARAFTDPCRALEAAGAERFDLAILDVMMPGMDGLELCSRLRSLAELPVVFLSAKGEETDVVVGFALGAEDYIAKPFKPRELVARVRARLRSARGSHGALSEPGRVAARGIEVDLREHRACLYDVPLDLTPKEFAILSELVQRAGEPVGARDLYERAWGEGWQASSSNTVMVHIRHLRQKLAAVDSSTAFIETAWGVGYRIAADERPGAEGDSEDGR